MSLCPNCKNPILKGWVYRCGYDLDNLRTIPPTYGRGYYCDHIPRTISNKKAPN